MHGNYQNTWEYDAYINTGLMFVVLINTKKKYFEVVQ